MEVELTEMNETLLEVYDQMVTLEKLLRDLTTGLKYNCEYMEDLTKAILSALSEVMG